MTFLFNSILLNRSLIWQLTKRNVVGRYKGSILGLLWSFLNPLFMLSIYTFAFSVVFKAKWGLREEGHLDFALILFASLTVFNLFGDVVREAPSLILSQPSFVKKVIFPLEILPVISLLSALIHGALSFLIFLLFFGLANFYIPWTVCYLPFVLLPLIFFALGISFFLASLGVYLRDIVYFIGHILTILMFTSPVFFSLERIPERFQVFIFLNPLATILENARKVMIFGNTPDLLAIFYFIILGFAFLWFGIFWFQKTRKGFADVI